MEIKTQIITKADFYKEDLLLVLRDILVNSGKVTDGKFSMEILYEKGEYDRVFTGIRIINEK